MATQRVGLPTSCADARSSRLLASAASMLICVSALSWCMSCKRTAKSGALGFPADLVARGCLQLQTADLVTSLDNILLTSQHAMRAATH